MATPLEVAARAIDGFRAEVIDLQRQLQQAREELAAAIERGAVFYRYAGAVEVTLWCWVEKAEAAEALVERILDVDGCPACHHNGDFIAFLRREHPKHEHLMGHETTCWLAQARFPAEAQKEDSDGA